MFTYFCIWAKALQLNWYACAFRVESELADGNYTLVRELVEEEVQNGEVNALVTEQVPQDPEPNCEQEGKHRSMT